MNASYDKCVNVLVNRVLNTGNIHNSKKNKGIDLNIIKVRLTLISKNNYVTVEKFINDVIKSRNIDRNLKLLNKA